MKESILSERDDEPPSLSLLNEQRLQPAEASGTGKGLWPGLPQAKWEDWHWQMDNRLRTLKQLSVLLGLSRRQTAEYSNLIATFRYSVTPYYLSLIDWSDPNDPIRLQCLPDLREMYYEIVGNADPLEEEKDTQVPGLVHRYPDRVLAVVTGMCSMYCRHCTRKRIWKDGEFTRTRKELSAMVSYVRNNSKVREVVVSGGDPLTMNMETLDWFLGELSMIPHVEALRIGTRIPVVLPMRVTDDLAQMLSRHRPLWINTQFNHAREVTAEAAEACDKLLRAGIPVSNQSVLLKGVNDSTEQMRALCHALQRIMVRPYYLYQCDPVIGVEHFRTNVYTGIKIIEEMRGHTGGLCIPSFVVDAPGGGGKIPLQPFYLLGMSEEDIMLRNYEGMVFRYYNPREEASSGSMMQLGSRKTAQAPVLSDNRRKLRRTRKSMVDMTKAGRCDEPMLPFHSEPALTAKAAEMEGK